MPVKGIAAISGPFDFYPFEYDEVRNVFGKTDNPEGTQPVNLVTADEPPMLLASGDQDPIVRMQNTDHLAKKLKDSGDWVTVKYYQNGGKWPRHNTDRWDRVSLSWLVQCACANRPSKVGFMISSAQSAHRIQ